jgi:hypothetical protein
MKNKTQKQNNKPATKTMSAVPEAQSISDTRLPSRPEQFVLPVTENSLPPQPPAALETSSKRPYVNYAEREQNRHLSTDKVLGILRRWMPAQFRLAKVVGKWVWITFSEQPIDRVRAELSQIGFHWNNERRCWQHPCGNVLPRGSQEPEQKYAVWFPIKTEKRRRERDAREAAGRALGKALGERSLAQATA